jgi:hypothetical protein
VMTHKDTAHRTDLLPNMVWTKIYSDLVSWYTYTYSAIFLSKRFMQRVTQYLVGEGWC